MPLKPSWQGGRFKNYVDKRLASLRGNRHRNPLAGIHPPPVVVGGIGGSGTRLIAECLAKLGLFMGNDLNQASDNLLFTLLFKRIEILHCPQNVFNDLINIFITGQLGHVKLDHKQVAILQELASQDREQHPVSWLEERAQMAIMNDSEVAVGTPWGWKEPNCHIVLERLKMAFSGMKYIHVVRNGLDMAHSNNQNQLKLWGAYFLGEDCNLSPKSSLKYWCKTHRRILEIGNCLGKDFLLLNFDAFCLNPKGGVAKLAKFLNIEPNQETLRQCYQLVRPPSSIGRFKKYGTGIFDEKDVSYVETLGFDVHGESGHHVSPISEAYYTGLVRW